MVWVLPQYQHKTLLPHGVGITPQYQHKTLLPHGVAVWVLPQNQHKTLFSHGVGITLVPTQNHLTPWCEWLVTQLSHLMEWMQLFVPAHPVLGHHAQHMCFLIVFINIKNA